MNFCTKCGSKLEENDSFCTNCGQKVNDQLVPDEIVPQKQIIHDNQITETINTKISKRLKILISICIALIIVCTILYTQKYTIYFEYYTYKANKSSAPVDKLSYSDRALYYKVNQTSLNNYEDAIKQNDKNLNLVVTTLENDKNLLSKSIYNSLMIDAYTVQVKKHISANNNYAAFKTFLKLSTYGYDYRNSSDYKKIMINLCNKLANSNFKGVDELNDHAIAFGDIDNDGTDEIIQITNLFSDSDLLNDTSNNDPTSYVVAYKFNGSTFTKSDELKIDMINKGSRVFIGKPNKDINALILDAFTGVHYGECNAYYIKNGHLMQLIPNSEYSSSPVDPKDIDNDGYIEFPSMDIDPNSPNQSEAGSDKIITWYKVDSNGVTTQVKKDFVKN